MALLEKTLQQLKTEEGQLAHRTPAIARRMTSTDTKEFVVQMANIAARHSLCLRNIPEAAGIDRPNSVIHRLLEDCFVIDGQSVLLTEILVLDRLEKLVHLLIPLYSIAAQTALMSGNGRWSGLLHDMLKEQGQLALAFRHLLRERILLTAEHDMAQPLYNGTPLDFPGPLLVSWWQGLSH